MLERFNHIASGIKRNAKMEGILVNLQVAPQAVVCMLYPKNNTEDFSDGVFLDSAGAIGHDLLTDPDRSFIAEQTVPSDDLVIAGPLKLTQCEDCAPTVQEALIARLPIYSKTDIITVNGVDYPRWGFAVAIINWDAVVRQSGVYNTFEEAGLEFQLTRTDVRVDDDGRLAEKVRTHLCSKLMSCGMFAPLLLMA
jgi:sensor domain CHASE-containing protein